MIIFRSPGSIMAAAFASSLSLCSMPLGAELLPGRPSDPLGAALRGMSDPRYRQTPGAFGGPSVRRPGGKPAGSKLARKASRGRL